MLLTTEEIRRRILDTSVSPKDRLVITPVLDWSNQAKPGQAALDLRLGQNFTVPRRTKLARLDPISENRTAELAMYNDRHQVWIGDYFVLHPRQFVLGETLEWIHLPANLAGTVTCRSSWGRDGLVIATATGVHPRYAGILTLELTNLGEIPLRLYPGLTVAQLFLYEVLGGAPEPETVLPSAFSTSTLPMTGDPAKQDKAIIRGFQKRRGLPDPPP